MKTQNPQHIFNALHKRFGSHSEASRQLGYASPVTYRRARRLNRLAPWRVEKAMALLSAEGNGRFSTNQ